MKRRIKNLVSNLTWEIFNLCGASKETKERAHRKAGNLIENIVWEFKNFFK